MKKYSLEQLCYFARYVVNNIFPKTNIPLLQVRSHFADWQRFHPDEENDERITVEEQLQRDITFYGKAYYVFDENGNKKRIDPTRLVTMDYMRQNKNFV